MALHMRGLVSRSDLNHPEKTSPPMSFERILKYKYESELTVDQSVVALYKAGKIKLTPEQKKFYGITD